MSHIQISDVTTDDVHDLAYDIAQEFEKIVALYGIDKLKPVIEKVINVLEILESNVKKIDQLSVELDDLKSNYFHLTSEKIVNDHEKSKLKQIYEESEESWQAEVMNLKSELSTVKSENELLKSYLALIKENSATDDPSKFTVQDQENINKLQRTIRQKDKQIQENICNIKSLNARVQELVEMNKILHMKNQEAKNDISKLIIEKNNYKTELIVQKKENVILNESLSELINSCLHTEKNMPNLSDEQTSEEFLRRDNQVKQEINLIEKIKRLQSELHYVRSRLKYEQNICKLNSDENKSTFSKIHQFFHLFLGLTAISELCWY